MNLEFLLQVHAVVLLFKYCYCCAVRIAVLQDFGALASREFLVQHYTSSAVRLGGLRLVLTLPLPAPSNNPIHARVLRMRELDVHLYDGGGIDLQLSGQA